MTKTLYTTSVISTGNGRNGQVKSADSLLDLALSFPKEFGGEGGNTNPEQLFAAGYAACFHSALKLVADREKISLGETTVNAQVNVHPTDDDGFFLSVALHITAHHVMQADIEELVNKAHQVCPYSNAVKGNIDVTLAVSIA
ncbi:Organic hydroperoxide resistance protein-like 2 [Xenorhabdus poinarii G6]|uniref:Organic hydroperoxide resistance protein-like 2 n=1 Tax=Xenorhabdus poinarii G6 TaxID=1354304 RepID=A0A068QYC4_9GAMM|nr:organic hydroperoxide resistance protein [Xenorhabdus poinarii]CDG19764.1 Organic hydroperoxide resistance protein-like 2 [Xenorhabdus poinarii G6]